MSFPIRRRLSFASVLAFTVLIFATCDLRKGPDFPTDIQPPDLEQRPVELTKHGDTRIDPYYWVRERENPDMLDYLEAENEYLRAMMEHTEPLQETLFEEMKGRIKQDDASVPVELDGYFYYVRYEEGKEYAIHARRKGSMDAPEEVLIDANEFAGDGYFSLSSVEVSHDGTLLAFAIDTVGRRFYTIHFKDLRTGDILADEIHASTPNIVWAADNKTLFYTKQDPVTLRFEKVYRHTLGQDPSKDPLVYEEKDDTFSTWVYSSKSRRYILIANQSTLSTEVRVIPSEAPTTRPVVFEPRRRTHEYFVDHAGDQFYIRTNWRAENFRIMRVGEGATTRGNWVQVLAHDPLVLIEGMDVFKGHLAVNEVFDGLQRVRIMDLSGVAAGASAAEASSLLAFDEPAYTLYSAANPAYETTTFRYVYTSMTTPASTYNVDMVTQEKTLLKETQVLGGFRKDRYVTERIFATAADGARIPVSLVYRRGTPLDGTSPLLQHAYGAYGYSTNPTFSTARVSLLDRGFIYAIAHVRGGSEMGRQWYEQGRLEHKVNTFTDFIAVSEHLVKNGYTNASKLYASGGSAGGLLMGAIVNMRPELYNGVIAAVPFVDVITTMLDDTIPLTTSEYDEWGNPNDPEFYRIMLAYSPYDQVKAQDYPNLYVTSGLHDSQVQYFEPTKWVAKLRDVKTDDNVLFLYTNMEAGHGGASGRFRRLQEVAREYAFLMELEGITH